MNLEPEFIEASVYYTDPVKDRHFVKVSFLGTGMYINSFSVQPSQYGDSKYWVQAPMHRQGSKWVDTVQFDKGLPTWEIIKRKCLEAVEVANNEFAIAKHAAKLADNVLEDISDGPINLDEIPF